MLLAIRAFARPDHQVQNDVLRDNAHRDGGRLAMPTMPTAATLVAGAVLVNAVVVWMVAYKPVVPV